MIITLVITAVIDSVFLCGAIDADAQFLPQFFFRIVFNEADSLVFTICLHEVNVDAGVFVLRAYFDLEYSAIGMIRVSAGSWLFPLPAQTQPG